MKLILGPFTWGPKSQHGGIVPVFEPQKIIEYGGLLLKLNLDYFMKKYWWDLF
jgi:hypothetical protein